MPVTHTYQGGKPGYKWGDQGHFYPYEEGDPESRRRAREKAAAQGRAIQANEDVVKSPLFDIKKYYEDEQLVFGWASVAKNADGSLPVEWQGDEIDMEQMEPAIYDFVLSLGITKEMHRPEEAKGTLVESLVLTKEKMAAMGIPEGLLCEGWWVGFKVHDRSTFQKVKSGKYKMFSIEGKGTRVNM